MDNAYCSAKSKNGDILAMAGKQIDKNGKLTDYDLELYWSICSWFFSKRWNPIRISK